MIHKSPFSDLLQTGPVDDGIMSIRDGIVNLYVLRTRGSHFCIDAGWRRASVARSLKRLGLNAQDMSAVFLTHFHWDHAGGLPAFENADIFAGQHEKGSSALPRLKAGPAASGPKRLKDRETVVVDDVTIQALHTPGHTAGSLSYLVDGHLLFTGDALRIKKGAVFPFPACFNDDATAHAQSIRRLARLRGIDCLLTGHSGISRNPAQAFAGWRGTLSDIHATGDSR